LTLAVHGLRHGERVLSLTLTLIDGCIQLAH
jgi:hypothetical protein